MKINDRMLTPKGKIERVAKIRGMRVWTYTSQMPYKLTDLKVVKRK